MYPQPVFFKHVTAGMQRELQEMLATTQDRENDPDLTGQQRLSGLKRKRDALDTTPKIQSGLHEDFQRITTWQKKKNNTD